MSEKFEATFNCYQGELTLKQITPVIEAFYGQFDLKRQVIDNKLVFVQYIAGDRFNPSWEDIKTPVITLAKEQYGVDIDQSLAIKDVLVAFSKVYATQHKFSVEEKQKLDKLFQLINFDKFIYVGGPFKFCRLFDDGHGLSELRMSGYENVRNIDGSVCVVQTSFFASKEVSFGNSANAISVGKMLDTYLAKDDYVKAMQIIMHEIEPLFAAISDPKKKQICISRITQALAIAYMR